MSTMRTEMQFVTSGLDIPPSNNWALNLDAQLSAQQQQQQQQPELLANPSPSFPDFTFLSNVNLSSSSCEIWKTRWQSFRWLIKKNHSYFLVNRFLYRLIKME